MLKEFRFRQAVNGQKISRIQKISDKNLKKIYFKKFKKKYQRHQKIHDKVKKG